MKQQIQIVLEVSDGRDWHKIKMMLKAVLRWYGLRCVKLDVATPPVAGVIRNEVGAVAPDVSTDLNK